MKSGIVLFGHGARDPRWAEPMERLRALVAAERPETPVVLAFLEIMEPDVFGAAAALVGEGCEVVRVVPVFLGQGGHVRKDLPRLADALRARYPGITVEVRPAIGEDPDVLASIARAALAGL